MYKRQKFHKEHQEWFEISWSLLDEVIKDYPNSHNTLNTAAWLGGRAKRKLEQSHQFIQRALELRPHQGAYLDTQAEVFFAQKKRKQALEWSQKAVDSVLKGQGALYPSHYQSSIYMARELEKQTRRFRNQSF